MASTDYEHGDLQVTFNLDGETPLPIFTESGSLTVHESMDSLVPTAVLEFTDFYSAMTAYYPLSQATLLELRMQDDDNLRSLNFFPFNFKQALRYSSKDASPSRLTLLSSNCEPLMMTSEYRSYRGRASDYVISMARRMGLTADVEATKGEYDWICPGWRLPQMLRYLAQHSVSESGSSGYIYYITSEGVLVFKSVDKMFDDASDEPEDITTITMFSEDSSARDLQIVQNLYSAVVMGRNSLNTSYQDLEVGSSVNQNFGYQTGVNPFASHNAVSASVSDSSISRTLPERYKSDARTPLAANKELFKKSLIQAQATTVKLTVKAEPFKIRLGKVVDLIIPAMASQDINMPFSGRYFVKEVVTYGKREFHQIITLQRPGLNFEKREDVL